MPVTKLGLLRQLGALTVGCILSLLFISILFYLCQRCFFRRTRVLEIQQAYITELLTPTETNTEETLEVQHDSSPSGFDPKKLYAKIKEDLHYGRLWKSYQGSKQNATQKCLSRQIYFLLGDSPLSKKDQEDKLTDPDTTSLSLENST
ncbi:immunoglobulin domain-containing protein [Trichomycterus rosablanca]|uniref:immunoglobulin domain-containing protein n=1 Tax=Trichomycterus rosablanca TaxID=2290929 RepID=UPI002F35772F